MKLSDMLFANAMMGEGGGGGGSSDFEVVEMTFELAEGVAEAPIYGMFIFDYGQAGEYNYADLSISETTTVHTVMYKGVGYISGPGLWYEGSNISEYGEFTGGGTVTIHESSD